MAILSIALSFTQKIEIKLTTQKKEANIHDRINSEVQLKLQSIKSQSSMNTMLNNNNGNDLQIALPAANKKPIHITDDINSASDYISYLSGSNNANNDEIVRNADDEEMFLEPVLNDEKHPKLKSSTYVMGNGGPPNINSDHYDSLVHQSSNEDYEDGDTTDTSSSSSSFSTSVKPLKINANMYYNPLSVEQQHMEVYDNDRHRMISATVYNASGDAILNGNDNNRVVNRGYSPYSEHSDQLPQPTQFTNITIVNLHPQTHLQPQQNQYRNGVHVPSEMLAIDIQSPNNYRQRQQQLPPPPERILSNSTTVKSHVQGMNSLQMQYEMEQMMQPLDMNSSPSAHHQKYDVIQNTSANIVTFKSIPNSIASENTINYSSDTSFNYNTPSAADILPRELESWKVNNNGTSSVNQHFQFSSKNNNNNNNLQENGYLVKPPSSSVNTEQYSNGIQPHIKHAVDRESKSSHMQSGDKMNSDDELSKKGTPLTVQTPRNYEYESSGVNIQQQAQPVRNISPEDAQPLPIQNENSGLNHVLDNQECDCDKNRMILNFSESDGHKNRVSNKNESESVSLNQSCIRINSGLYIYPCTDCICV